MIHCFRLGFAGAEHLCRESQIQKVDDLRLNLGQAKNHVPVQYKTLKQYQEYSNLDLNGV